MSDAGLGPSLGKSASPAAAQIGGRDQDKGGERNASYGAGFSLLPSFRERSELAMFYRLTGFSQHGPNRVFRFERVETNAPRIQFSVSADLGAAHRNHLALQELPGMCSRLLQASPENGAGQALILTESQMSEFAVENARVAANAAAARASKFGHRGQQSPAATPGRTGEEGASLAASASPEHRHSSLIRSEA